MFSDNMLFNKRRVLLISLLFAFWMCIPIINDLYGAIRSGKSIMTYLYAGTGALLFVMLLLFVFRNDTKKIFFNVAFLMFVLVFYLITLINNVSNLETKYYFVFFILPFLFAPMLSECKNYSFKYLFLFTSAIPLPCVFFLNKIFALDSQSIISMGTSYHFLTPIIACLVFTLFYFKYEERFAQFLYLPVIGINIAFLVKLFLYGSRGPIICIIASIFLFLIFKYKPKKEKAALNGWKSVFFIAVLIAGVVFFWDIIEFLSKMVDSNFFNKMLKLRERGDVSNNRFDIYKTCFSLIMKRPITGYGISSFQYFTGTVYPHNFFLQLLFDGGLILFCAVMIPLLAYIAKLFIHCTREEFIFFIYFFSVAIVKSMFSGNIWDNDKLWILISFCIFNFYFRDDRYFYEAGYAIY